MKSTSKPWYKSKTLIGVVIIAITVFLRRLFDIELGDPDKAELGAMLTTFGEFVGVALAWWGRVSAKKTIEPILKS